MKHRSMKAAVSIAAALTSLALVACGGGDKKDKPASQVAAKVNKEEISVHQINHVLQQQRVRAEQTDRASRQALERLIDQELAVQGAAEMKLDRDAQVLRQIEAARREIIARAYAERVSETAAKPKAEEVARYYADHPELFKERRIYSLQEVTIEASPDKVAALQPKVAAAKSLEQVLQELRAADVRFGVNYAVRPAEQLPLGNLKVLAGMKDGERIFGQVPGGARIVMIVSSRSEPVDEQRATPAIEQFLSNENKRKFLEADAKRLRTAAKIEYVGRFAEAAASAPQVSAPAAAATAAPAATPASAALDFDSALGLKK